MNSAKDLIPRDGVEELVAARNAALQYYDLFFDLLDQAHELRQKAESAIRGIGGLSAGYVGGHIAEIEEFQNATKPPAPELYRRVARRLVDLRVWAALVERTELEHLMDKTAKDELREQLSYVPERVDRYSGKVINQEEILKAIPEVTVESVLATLDGFRDRAEEIWLRGIATAFSTLDRRFRSHDGFKVGDRMILSGAFDASSGSWNYHRNQRDTLLDVERVLLVLDGKKPRAAYGGIVGVIDEERRPSFRPMQSEHQGDYFKVRIFLNGNAHLWFTRKDLVKKINKLLARYYGAGLGWGRTPEPEKPHPFEKSMERAPARSYGLFPTPDALAERVIEKAELWSKEPLRILEPSAGTGQLAGRAANACLRHQHQVTAVEIQPELAAGLREHGSCARVLCRDFLMMPPEPIYDRVVMNPPFDRGRDLDHVWHAWHFLRPGGRLVAIMSASAEFSASRKAAELHKVVDENRGYWVDLPPGSFSECGTNVNATMLIVDKRR